LSRRRQFFQHGTEKIEVVEGPTATPAEAQLRPQGQRQNEESRRPPPRIAATPACGASQVKALRWLDVCRQIGRNAASQGFPGRPRND
jgi:hypothetical protein